jgi:hypothetical protein
VLVLGGGKFAFNSSKFFSQLTDAAACLREFCLQLRLGANRLVSLAARFIMLLLQDCRKKTNNGSVKLHHTWIGTAESTEQTASSFRTMKYFV